MRRFVPILILVLSALAPAASAQVLWADVDEVVSVTVRPGWRESDGRHFAALDFRLKPGWTTYWRSPGAAGIAPRLTWRGSRNVKSMSVHWPTPRISTTAGYQTLGYSERLILPIEVQPNRRNTEIRLRGTLEIGVCSDICLPAKLKVSAVLPAVAANDPRIIASLDNRPRLGRGVVKCRLAPTNDGLELNARVPMAARLGNIEAVAVEMAQAQGRIWITDTVTRRQGSELHTRTEFIVPDETSIAVDRASLRFTVVGARGAVEFFGCTG